MEEILLWVVLVLLAGLLLLFWLGRKGNSNAVNMPELVRAEFRNHRSEMAEDASRLRQEIAARQKEGQEAVTSTVEALGKSQLEAANNLEQRVKELTSANERRLENLRETMDAKLTEMQQADQESASKLRESNENKLESLRKTMDAKLTEMQQADQESAGKLRGLIERQLGEMRTSNEQKLEAMRTTVDEKLQSTLEKRLSESFKLVSERLEAVQKGLGEMQNLATGVGDLKRVLTNVKTRGTWGEYQIGDILEQVLTQEQYAKNVQPKPNSGAIVEYAIKLPGRADDDTVWLPIDAKFPQDDYQRLLDASEAADAAAVERSQKALKRSIRDSAKDIREKYLAPPHTTDFAIMFLPTEGLYAEVLRQPGMLEELQQTHRVVIAGPTTLSAILSSLRMGFRTLAIEQRSSEVWQVLAAVKTEFGKFGGVLGKLKKQLHTASNTIGETETRTRVMERKLREVEQLPADEAQNLLGMIDESNSKENAL